MRLNTYHIPRILTALVLATTILYVIFRVYVIGNAFSVDIAWYHTLFVLLFFFAEMFFFVLALGYFSNVYRAWYYYERSFVLYKKLAHKPSVTVLIPARNEPISVLRKTLFACKQMQYKNKKIVLLDDSTSSKHKKHVEALAEEIGVHYFARPEPGRAAKAGNINDYLPNCTSKYVAVFDADYRPSHDFLRLVVQQLEDDDSIGYVQTPQYYGNTNESAVARMAQMVQSTFYEYICEAKSSVDGMFIAGTNFVIRRKALTSIGGFVENSITEDFATTFPVLEAGYKGKFFNYAAAFGDGPITVVEYFKQQYRWARGTIGVFQNNFKRLVVSRKLSVMQKVELALSGVYYFIGIAWLILLIMPILYILFRVPIYFADPLFYLFAYFPYFIFSTMNYLYTLSDRRYSAFDLLSAQALTMMTIPTFVQATLDSLINRKATFQVVNKEVKNLTLRERLPLRNLWVQYIFLILNFTAVTYGVLLLSQSGFDLALTINIFWAAFHGSLMLLCIGAITYEHFHKTKIYGVNQREAYE